MELLERRLDKYKTKKSFQRVVWFYDIWSWLTERKAAAKVINSAGIQDGQKILEIACGTGVVFEKIVQSNPGGTNLGIDLSPDMLQKAKKRLRRKTGHFELYEGDALQLDFDDETFDIVINNFMVDLMPESSFDQLAREFYRVLRPGGTLVLSTFSFGRKKINRIWLWLAKHAPELLTGCRPVSFQGYLMKSGFCVEEVAEISQNTFPSQVIKAIKAKDLLIISVKRGIS